MDEVVISGYYGRCIRCGFCGVRVIRVHDTPLCKRTESKGSLVLFPNPANKGQSITVQSKTNSNSYQIISAAGQLLRSGKIRVNKGQVFQLSTVGLSNGVYFIRLNNPSSKEQLTEKFIIQ